MFLKSSRKYLLLYGKPRSGKTTLLNYLYEELKKLNLPYHLTGFITKELRRNGERVGFDLIYLKDPTLSWPLARIKDLAPPKKGLRIGKYWVFPENLEKLLLILKEDLKKPSESLLLFIDEIGKMEVLSPAFINFLKSLEEKRVPLIATLGQGEHPLLQEWAQKELALYCEVTIENREFLKERLKLEFFRQGKLLVIEGIDGAGKSSLLQQLRTHLGEEKIVFSFEPTSGIFGKKLRELLKKDKGRPQEILELFIKDRKEHIEKLILPGLKEGKMIFLDRYYLSTIAYQGVNFPLLDLLKLNETLAPLPDLVFYLDVSVNLALTRVIQREEERTLFEKEDFLKRVSQNYEKLLPLFNHIRIQAEKPLEEVYLEVQEVLKSFL